MPLPFRVPIEVMRDRRRSLLSLFSLLTAAGLLIMLGLVIWSFRLDKDFSRQYTEAFSHNFWRGFFGGAGASLLGCLGFSVTLKSRTVILAGIVAVGIGFALFFFLIPSTDFESWSGATAYSLIFVVLMGSAILLISAALRWSWRKRRLRSRPV